MPSRTIDSTRDPEGMTAEERRAEVASILARGAVRLVRERRLHLSAAAESAGIPTTACLDLPAESRLSVAPRPRG